MKLGDLDKLKKLNRELDQLETFLRISEKCWNRIFLKDLSRNLQFSTSYGFLSDSIHCSSRLAGRIQLAIAEEIEQIKEDIRLLGVEVADDSEV